MTQYTKALVAVDFSPMAEKVVGRAKLMRKGLNVSLCFIHVVEYLPPIEPVGDMFMGVDWGVNEQELVDVAKQQMARLMKRQGVDDCDWEVVQGNARSEILGQAKEKGCDLIVIGSHGRRGLGRLLGSTADTVLHRAECDVLAVRAD
jgi:universal stress protein A